jgi:hypothetical protein
MIEYGPVNQVGIPRAGEVWAMLNTVTLDQAIDTALQLPTEQQEMLVDILRSRQIEMRRQEIAADARASIAAFRAGKLKAYSAEELIAELHQSLEGAE